MGIRDVSEGKWSGRGHSGLSLTVKVSKRLGLNFRVTYKPSGSKLLMKVSEDLWGVERGYQGFF